MPIEYPEGPLPTLEIVPGVLKPGEGINNIPFEAQTLLDFTTPPGGCSGVFFGLIFQLPKWGFQVFKIDESIEVSPVFKAYYDLTIGQKQQLEAQMKAGLASISTAISDLELVVHDLRKYGEFMNYFAQIERGKKEKKPELVKKGEQTLKAIFIDQVDVHTGEGIALKLIAPRWPTIIADFMRLEDEDTNPKKISDKYKISEAEGVVLATKNKLYQEWRDNMFRPLVFERYKTLLGLVEARRISVEEYKRMLRPIIARHRSIKEMLSESGTTLPRLAHWIPGSQAVSIDRVLLWAWMPFAPEEKYKIYREKFDKVPAWKAGFNSKEIQELHIEFDERDDTGKVIKSWNEMVEALPIEPSIDDVVRRLIKKVEKHYGVKITAKDLYNARNIIVNRFKESKEVLGGTLPWVFSPYYVFIELPMERTVIRLPNGTEVEDLYICGKHGAAYAATQTQNIIIVHCLEIIAREKQLDEYIKQMLGEMGVIEKKLVPIEELLEIKYPEIFEREETRKPSEVLQPFKSIQDSITKFRNAIGDFLKSSIGLDIGFLRARGPYEFLTYYRLAKYYYRETGLEFNKVKNFLKSNFKVPGARW